VPKHASWLNMVEIEIGVLARQCLDRRIDSYARLRAETAAWEKRRNADRARIKWMFTTKKARMLATPRTVGKQINSHIEEPVRSGNRLLVLRRGRAAGDGGNGPFSYWIETKTGDENA
jgi:hypothetical protein